MSAGPIVSASTAEDRRERYWQRWTAHRDAPAHERQLAVDYHAQGTLVFEALKGHGTISGDIFDAVIRAVNSLSDKSDFALAALVRAFYFCEGRLGDADDVGRACAGSEAECATGTSTMTDAQRREARSSFANYPFWIDSENVRGDICFWTENHQSLLLSSHYLLARHPALAAEWGEARRLRSADLLRHFLSMKLRYGFFELNSPVYSTITMAGLLNIVDLCDGDDEDGIRGQAEEVLRKMLGLMLEVPTIDGAFACASTRFFDRDIVQREMRAIQTVVAIVFGIESGSRPNNAKSFQSAIIASSNWLCRIADEYEWRDQVNATLPLTPAIADDASVSSLTDADRMLFNFSAGNFFPPARVKQHIALMRQHDLFSHRHFKEFAFLKSMPAFSLKTVSSLLSGITEGHAHTGGCVRVFRAGSFLMSSLSGHGQKFGFQKLSFVCCVDAETIVWLECGQRRKQNQDNVRDAVTPTVTQSEDGTRCTVVYEQKSLVLSFLHAKMAKGVGHGGTGS